MIRRILLPLYKLEVSYVVRHGRRWSALEHLVLWACRDPISPADLAHRTGMPTRLVSECLVNLLRANWVELRLTPAGTLFAATRSGAKVAEKAMPDRFMEFQSRTTHLFLERLTGEAFSHDELTVVYRSQPGFTALGALGAERYNPAVVGPELIARLPLGRDDAFERLRERPRILPGEAYAALELQGATLCGLPDRTPASVGMAVVRALAERETGHATRSAAPAAVPPLTAGLGLPLVERQLLRPFTFTPESLVVGGEEHLDRARAVIGGAKRIVVVHSTFVGGNVKNLLPALAAAAERGVQVYLHWGKKDDPEKIAQNPSEIAARLAVGSLPEDARRNIHLGSGTTGSHAKVLLADAGDGAGYVALVGSCNWLDSPFQSVEASVQVGDPGLIGLIATTLAYLVAPSVGAEPVVSKLIEVHADCSEQPGHPAGPHRAMLVADEDHFTAVRDTMNRADPNGHILVGSHKLGHAAETTVFDSMREAARHGARVELVYTKVLPNLGPDAVEDRRAELASGGVMLKQGEWEMHAKFLTCNDDTLLVTSFNLMATTLNSRLPRSSELGVLLVGPGVVEEFTKRLAGKGAALPPPRAHTEKRRHRRRRAKAAVT